MGGFGVDSGGGVERLREKVRLFRRGVPAGVFTADVDEFVKGAIYPNIGVENGELRICIGSQCHSVVRAGRFGESVNEVRDGLLKQGFVVVVGPKGIGKSTLAAAVIWELMGRHEVGLIARVVMLNEDNRSRFEAFIENYGERFGEYFGRLLILYDPVSTRAHEKVSVDVEAPMQANIERTVKNLMDVVNSISPKASRPLTLIVLPSDVYDALSEEIRDSLERYRLDASLNDAEFLAGLIREYTKARDKPSGCALSDNVLNDLAGKVAGFDSGHALIARLIGKELLRNNCSVDKVKKLISETEGKAEALIIQYINSLFKVHEDPKTAEALVEVFALRRPFVNMTRPGVPILTPGIIKLIGKERGAGLLQGAEGEELRGWLAIRQHDLIEEAIEELLDCIVGKGEECEELGDALEPWSLGTVRRSLREVSNEVKDRDGAVEYFADNYGKEFTGALRSFSNCWRRVALIIGLVLTERIVVPRPEDLPGDDAKFLSDALRECGVDNYLLVGNVIPPLIWYLIKNHARALTEAFVGRYNEVIDEIGRVLSIVRDTPLAVAGPYGLGLALIIARAAELGKYVEPSGADVVLHFTSFAIKDVSPPSLITPILRTLKPLRGKAPHRYLELLNSILNMANLDLDTVKYVLEELNETLDNYGYAIKEHTWSLVHAITTYANLLRTYPVYLSDEVRSVISRVLYLLNELDKSKSSLSAIAWAIALAPALMQGVMGWFMENMFSINMANKVNEVAEELGKLRGKIQELMSDGEFMSYVESVSIKADEEAVKTAILNVTSFFKHALALYKLNNDEFDEAARLFNEAAKEFREMNAHEDYIANSDLALRAEAIKGSLVGDELVNGFRQLYEEAFNEEHFMPTARYLNIVSNMLGGYLVSLALTGNYEKINELLEKHWWVLNADKQASVLTRLMLNALLGSKDRKDQLGSELKDKLSITPWELVDAFGPHIHNKFLPALMVIFGAISPEDGIKLCKAFIDEDCVNTILAVKGSITAVTQLREWLINAFREVLIVRLNSFRELGVDVDTVFNEFRGLVNGLDGKSLVRLITPVNSRASLAFMLYALINGEEKLAKAHALYGAANAGEKLLTKLLLETHKACCDLSNEPFKHTIAKLFLYHV